MIDFMKNNILFLSNKHFLSLKDQKYTNFFILYIKIYIILYYIFNILFEEIRK